MSLSQRHALASLQTKIQGGNWMNHYSMFMQEIQWNNHNVPFWLQNFSLLPSVVWEGGTKLVSPRT